MDDIPVEDIIVKDMINVNDNIKRVGDNQCPSSVNFHLPPNFMIDLP